VTKRIAALPCFILYSARSIGGRARRGWPRSGCGETCHGGLIDAKHNQESGALAFTSPAMRGEVKKRRSPTRKSAGGIKKRGVSAAFSIQDGNAR
jgi:hypothetical protein